MSETAIERRQGWLGKHVEWFYATSPEHPGGRGTVVAYSADPQVFIETADGEKFWWSANLVRDVTCEYCDGTGRVG